MNYGYCKRQTDYGAKPYVTNVEQMAEYNTNFRTAIWTGCHLQMTLMSIPTCQEIGMEMHPDTDQYIRVEQGNAVVRMGRCKNQMDFQQNLEKGDGVFVPAGTWHNIINTGKCPLKVSSVYAPSHHPWGTVHKTKEEADKAEY